MEVCSPEQREAYHLIPFLLHTHNPPEMGEIDGEIAPCGIFGFSANSASRQAFIKYFGSKGRYELRNTLGSCIEFLALMGSVGTVAFSSQSDFDYWVCLSERLKEHELELLDKKLRRIEQWCEDELGVEVHFFTMTSQTLVSNDFGQVSKESCGSAQAKLLKEEFFRGSLLVMGKIPTWWIIPHDLGEEAEAELLSSVETSSEGFQMDHVNIGMCQRIPPGEFLGAGLWQLNKGVMSPYKSVLKLALLLSYCANPEQGWLSDDLKKTVQERMGNVGDYDSYVVMIGRLIGDYAKGLSDSSELNEDLETLRNCFFIKVGVKVSSWIDAKAKPKTFREKIMLKHVQAWGWSRRYVEDLEDVGFMSAKKAIALKARLESFMLRGLKKLLERVGVEALREVMTEEDESRLLNRLLTIYERQRERVEWFYPPFNKSLLAREYTLIENEEGGVALYKGHVNFKSRSKFEEDSCIKVEPSLIKMGMWMAYNGLLESKPNIRTNISHSAIFVKNMNDLGALMNQHLGRTQIPQLDGSFSKPPQPRRWVMGINLLPRESLLKGYRSKVEEAKPYTNIFYRERKDVVRHGPNFDQVARFKEAPSHRIDRILDGLNDESEVVEADLDAALEVAELETTLTVVDSIVDDDASRVLLHPDEDVLNAWLEEKNLCESMFLIEKNSWGEVVLHPYDGEDFFVKCLVYLLQKEDPACGHLAAMLELVVGLMEIDSQRLKQRCVRLIEQISHLFESAHGRFAYFYTVIGGQLYVISKEYGDVSYRKYDNLAQAALHINLNGEEGYLTSFDVDYPKWGFYQACEQDLLQRPSEQVKLYFHKGTKACYMVMVDASGQWTIHKMDRDDLRTSLPRMVMSTLEWVDEDHLFVGWYKRDDHHRGVIEDITEKALSASASIAKRASEMELVLPWSSAQFLLKKYANECGVGFDNDVAKNEVRYVARQVERLREGSADVVYPIHLTKIEILDFSDDERSGFSPTLGLQLKILLEKACFQLMMGKTSY